VTLPELASLATAVGSGEIGAACDIPEKAATTKAATATANAVRITIVLLMRLLNR
jgi:hypothetical protein